MADHPEHPNAAALATSPGAEQTNPGIAFEPGDWPLKPVAAIYVGLLVLIVISAFVLIAAYPTSLPDVNRKLTIAPPGPRLQTDAEGNLRRFRAEEEKRLNGYSWIDKSKGVVRIPIEQAMKKLATTGIPDFPKAQQQ
jgi:hypothetical protein